MISAVGSFGRPDLDDPGALVERLEQGLRRRRPELFHDEACGGWALVPVGLGAPRLDLSPDEVQVLARIRDGRHGGSSETRLRLSGLGLASFGARGLQLTPLGESALRAHQELRALGAPLDTSLDSLTPDTHAWALKVIDGVADQGVQLRVRSTLRSCQQQHELYLIGRVPVVDPKKQVTKADGCISWHVLGHAVDFDVIDPVTQKPTSKEAPYQVLGQVAKDLGGKWGGDFPGFPDIGHVEYHPGRTIEQACPDPQQCELAQARELHGEPPPAPPADDARKPPMSAAAKVVVGSALFAGLFAGYKLSQRRR